MKDDHFYCKTELFPLALPFQKLLKKKLILQMLIENKRYICPISFEKEKDIYKSAFWAQNKKAEVKGKWEHLKTT